MAVFKQYKVYEYDLDYAKDLLADAGYTKTDSNGVLRHKDDLRISFPSRFWLTKPQTMLLGRTQRKR